MRKKIVCILQRILVFFVICIFLLQLTIVPSKKAVSQIVSTDIENINTSKYSGIKEAIISLKAAHPNWNFKLLYTGLDWYEVIQNENKGHFAAPSNLIPANSSTYNNKWICSICGNQTYDTGIWLCASERAIKYMMDPRNFLDDENIFQFLELTYTNYNYDQIKKMVEGTYLNNTSTIDTIIDSAKTYNVNAYYIIARLIQEQGKSGTELVNGYGYNKQYAGYYNAFNIGATGNTRPDVVLNGLKRAYDEGWTSLNSSIRGGTQIIAQNYIARGQNTLYLQKFDVENSDGTLFSHQYMQNLLGAKNEALKITKVVNELGTVNNSYNFLIPIYENMPAFTETEPNLEYTQSDDLVKINVSDTLRIRNAPSGNQIIGTLNGGEIVTRVQMAQNKVNGTYWDKVKSNTGVSGYVARDITQSSGEYKLYLVPYDGEENQNSGSSGEHGNPGESENKNRGDINNDGRISPTDYVLIKNHIMQIQVLKTDIEKKKADVNNDGKISATDYVLIKNHIMFGTEI